MIIAICDDDDKNREYYHNKLSKILKSTELDIKIQTYSDGRQLLFEFDKNENIPDIIFLDIYMPKIDGIEVANKLRLMRFDGEIIFLTKSDSYWQNAFDVHAYHYIVKDNCPDEKFNSIVDNVIKSVIDKNEDYILFNSCGKNLSIKIKDILYFEVTKRIVNVVYLEGTFEFYSTLSKLEEQLFSRNFIRIHKSYLVSKNYIVKIYHNYVVLKDNTKLPLGRTYKNIINQTFNKGATQK